MKLLRLDKHSRKVCLSIKTGKCCSDIVSELKRFKIQIKIDSINDTPVLIEYPFFDVNDDGKLCVLLDDCIKELCQGRYVFNVMLDDCLLIDSIKFLWGGKPVVNDVVVEASGDDECYDETGHQEPVSQIVDSCCNDDCKPKDCKSCEPDPCKCPREELCDPNELLKRGC